MVSYKRGMRPGFEFILNDNNTWNEPVIILHSIYDLPDAYLMNDLIELSFSNKNYETQDQCSKDGN